VEPSCEEALELVPWVVNATASAEEQCGLYRHIAGCRACRTEFVQSVVLQRRLTRAVQALPTGGVRPVTELAGPLTSLVEALGGPAIVAQAVRQAIELPRTRPALTVNIPLVATVRVGT